MFIEHNSGASCSLNSHDVAYSDNSSHLLVRSVAPRKPFGNLCGKLYDRYTKETIARNPTYPVGVHSVSVGVPRCVARRGKSGRQQIDEWAPTTIKITLAWQFQEHHFQIGVGPRVTHKRARAVLTQTADWQLQFVPTMAQCILSNLPVRIHST